MVQEGYYGCEEFLHRLPQFLDGEHDPADEELLHDHLGWCEGCLRKYRFERSLVETVRGRLSQLAVPPSLRARIQSILAIAAPDQGDPAP